MVISTNEAQRGLTNFETCRRFLRSQIATRSNEIRHGATKLPEEHFEASNVYIFHSSPRSRRDALARRRLVHVCLGSHFGHRQNTLSLLDFPANARTEKNRETKGKFNSSLSFVRTRQTSYRNDCCRLKARDRNANRPRRRTYPKSAIPNVSSYFSFSFFFSLM